MKTKNPNHKGLFHMAIRGRKPKPAHLRLVGGNAGKRPIAATAGVQQIGNLGPAIKPRGMRGRASQLWDTTIVRATWLEWPDSEKAALWCYLHAEFIASKGKMISARIAQLRALGSELGFDPASRQRLGVQANPPNPGDDPANEYLDR
jgi:hypothetical protein